MKMKVTDTGLQIEYIVIQVAQNRPKSMMNWSGIEDYTVTYIGNGTIALSGNGLRLGTTGKPKSKNDLYTILADTPPNDQEITITDPAQGVLRNANRTDGAANFLTRVPGSG